MRARLMVLAAIVSLLFLPLQPGWGLSYQDSNRNDTELPIALDDDFFDDLPFEQRRQALREEVERNPNKNPTPSISKQYNLLIR